VLSGEKMRRERKEKKRNSTRESLKRNFGVGDRATYFFADLQFGLRSESGYVILLASRIRPLTRNSLLLSLRPGHESIADSLLGPRLRPSRNPFDEKSSTSPPVFPISNRLPMFSAWTPPHTRQRDTNRLQRLSHTTQTTHKLSQSNPVAHHTSKLIKSKRSRRALT
jgi:hypothetical protein